MTDNIVEAVFAGRRSARTRAVYQYDYGMILKPIGLDLPSTYEVHFGTSATSPTVTQLGTADGVTIPDAMLTTGASVYAYIYLHSGEDDGETVYSIVIPVIARGQITDEQPTPAEQSVITQAIAALNAGVETVQEIAEGIPEQIDTALAEAKASGEFDGPQGPKGADGVGVPAGGTTGQVLTKVDGMDYNTEWSTPEAGGVTDVQVNGTSILNNGVANVPKANDSTLGVVFAGHTYGVYGIRVDNNGELYIVKAEDGNIKGAANSYRPIVSTNAYLAVFYGLAKAAGDSTQHASSNAVGTYTETARSKISDMLSAPVTVTGTTPTITALSGIQYVCGEVSTLDITLPASGIVDVVFTSGSTPTVLTITPPTGVTVKWANGFDPTALEANTTYEINIMDGLGVAGQWT